MAKHKLLPDNGKKVTKWINEEQPNISDSDDSWNSEEELFYHAEKSKWKKSKKCRFVYPIIVAILAVIVVVLTGYILWHFKSKQSVCTSSTCVVKSGSIISKMDLTIDPCVDFYEFACGSWIKDTVIPPDKGVYNMFTTCSDKISDVSQESLTEEKGELNSEAIQKAKIFYKTCMDTETIEKLGITEVLKLINSLGSWTVTGDNITGVWNRDSWDLTTAIAATASLGIPSLLDIGVSQDSKNSSVHIMDISQAGLTLSQREEYLKNTTKYKDAFLKFAVQYGRLLQADDTVIIKMEKIYDFEKKLAEIFIPKEELQDREKTYHKMTVEEFQKMLNGQINILQYLQLVSKYDFKSSSKIIVSTPNYFTKLGLLLADTDKEVLANYVVWTMLQAIPGYLPNDFQAAALHLTKAEVGVKDLAPRWKRCVSKVSNQVGFATAAMYVNKKFSKDNRHEVEEMLNNVKRTLTEGLEVMSWMDSTTRQKAVEKAFAVGNMIGFPDWILVPDKLDEYYKNLTFQDGEFLLNHLSSRRFLVMKNMEKLHKQPDRTEWDMFPDEVNAYYSPPNNNIVFPAGILQPPFYDPDMPVPVKYGSVGMVIGHELTHGFDNLGRKYGKLGNLQNWWTEESANKFKSKSECMKDQYSHYSVNGVQLNGEYTLSENIADNGGVKFAYKAYKSSGKTSDIRLPGIANYSDDQLFFIGFTQAWCSKYRPESEKMKIMSDVHSIQKYRIIGSLSNFPEFSSAFNCPINTPMNPEKKCQVW